MPFNWTDLSEIVTPLSALIACGSLWSGFYLYRISMRDAEVRRMRKALVTARTLTQQLDRLLNYELGYEVAASIAGSAQVQVFLRCVHLAFFKDPKNLKSKDELEEYLKKHMPSIIASTDSRLADSFEEKLIRLDAEHAVLRFDHPGVARMVRATSNVLSNTYWGQKQMVHDENAWKTAVVQLYNESDKKSLFQDYDILCNELIEMFVGTWMNIMKKVNQANIDDTIASLQLVVERYLAKGPAEMVRISKYERSKIIIPEDKTKNISEDLREAEKCLGKALSHDDMLLLRQYSSQIETRSTDGQEEK